eukprot:Gb_03356 [translate_table: standard]
MPRIHPGAEDLCTQDVADGQSSRDNPTILTVWKKSFLFNCNGFNVIDSTGNLVLRVDNYGSYLKDEAVLMNGTGNTLITMRRKTLTLRDRWEGFRGDDFDPRKPMFSIRRSSLLQTKAFAEVFLKGERHANYHIEGSFSKRSCRIYGGTRCLVAEVKRKQATSGIMLGDDVFSLVVQPGFSLAFIVGLVVVLDRMSIRKSIWPCIQAFP